MSYRRCTLGLWDTSVPGIVFDENGVSNYAKYLLSLFDQFPRGDQGRLTWESILKEIIKQGKHRQYDCIIGVSGGTDSCYLLHLASEWGLRPLAVNIDNGFSSKISVENIRKVTTKLQIDFKTYVIDYDQVKITLSSYMKAALPWIDAPTDHAILSVLYMYAKKYGVKYILNGRDFRSEGKQPFLWTASDCRQLRYVSKTFTGKSISKYPCFSPVQYAYCSILFNIKRFHPFNFIEYDKDSARKFLSTEYQWEYYGEHHHENIFTKFAISYWLYEKFGIDKRIITYSSQVLNGAMDRQTALTILKNKPYDELKINNDINYILKKLSITDSEFEKIMLNKNHYVYDYPSYLEIILRHPRTARWLSEKFLKFEPLFLRQLNND